MHAPAFFSQAPAITLHDPLAELLGAAEGGLIDYHFSDAVKLAGHACPTVAGAWLATVRGLKALYGADTPVRGQISVALAETVDDGVAGVIASVAGLITGAAGAGGFKGLGGQYGRRHLLAFGISGVTGIRLTRNDTAARVDCLVHLHEVPADPRLGALLPAVVLGSANTEESSLFRQLWQDRVRRILIDHGDDPDVVSIRKS